MKCRHSTLRHQDFRSYEWKSWLCPSSINKQCWNGPGECFKRHLLQRGKIVEPPGGTDVPAGYGLLYIASCRKFGILEFSFVDVRCTPRALGVLCTVTVPVWHISFELRRARRYLIFCTVIVVSYQFYYNEHQRIIASHLRPHPSSAENQSTHNTCTVPAEIQFSICRTCWIDQSSLLLIQTKDCTSIQTRYHDIDK